VLKEFCFCSSFRLTNFFSVLPCVFLSGLRDLHFVGGKKPQWKSGKYEVLPGKLAS